MAEEHSTPLDPKDWEDPKNPQIVYTWEAPLRPYIKRSKRIIQFYLALALLLALIVIFFGDYILLIPMATLLFIFYVFTVTEPGMAKHKITQFGIETSGTTLRWEALDHFFFDHRFGYEILTIVTHPPYNYHVYMLVPSPEIKEKVTKILSEHIIYQQEPKKNLTDKLIAWFSKLVPEETYVRPPSASPAQKPQSL